MGTTLLPLQGAIIYDMIYLKQPVDINVHMKPLGILSSRCLAQTENGDCFKVTVPDWAAPACQALVLNPLHLNHENAFYHSHFTEGKN